MEKTMNQKISDALSILRPNAEWILRGDSYDGLEWLDEKQEAPTWTQVQSELNNSTKIEPTIDEKLASVGLSLDDLKSALGL